MFPQRFEAYGWHVLNLGEDIELDRLEEAVREAKQVEDRPTLIVLRTHIGIGSPHKQDTNAAHGSPLGEEEVRLTKEAYGWPPDEQFFVPDEALAHYPRGAGPRQGVAVGVGRPLDGLRGRRARAGRRAAAHLRAPPARRLGLRRAEVRRRSGHGRHAQGVGTR